MAIHSLDIELRMRRPELDPPYRYIAQLFNRPEPAFDSIEEALLADEKFGMKVSPVEGNILYFLLKSIGARKIVEIGTLYGYSAIWQAKALPADGVIHTFEFNEENAANAKKFFEQSEQNKKIKLHVGPAIEKLKDIESEGPFDAIFIDADKGGYPGYLDWAEKNVRQGGLIVGDNTFLFGGVYDPNTEESVGRVKAMRTFNERLADSKKYLSMMLPTAEGMTVAIKL